MRFLVLEDDTGTAREFQGAMQPLGHVVSIAPTVEVAQVALQAEKFGVAVLSSRLLSAARYSLVDYIRITQPDLHVMVVKDTPAPEASALGADWMLNAPVSPLEVVQVMEYLMDRSVQAVSNRSKRAYTYAGTRRIGQGHRQSLN